MSDVVDNIKQGEFSEHKKVHTAHCSCDSTDKAHAISNQTKSLHEGEVEDMKSNPRWRPIGIRELLQEVDRFFLMLW